MYFPEGFLASPSAWPDKEKERMITVTSGLKCSELYGKSDPLGSLVRMLLESSRWYSPARRLKWEVRPLYSERITEKEYCTDKNMLSKPFVETLNVKDTPSNRYLFRLVPSERRTEGIEFGLLPTVQTQGLKRCNSQGKTEFMPLELLPTPMATDIHHAERVAELKKRGAKGLRCRDKGEAGANGLTDWMDFHGMLPTPTAIDAGTGRINKSLSPNAKERPTIAMAAKMGLLPTPMAIDIRHEKRVKELKAAGGNTFHSRENGETRPNGLMDWMDFHGLRPTPTASDKNTGTTKDQKDGRNSLLNPRFVAEMMSFPVDWTVLPFLNGGKNP